MKAAVYSRTGPARDVLSIADKARPEPQTGEVRVRVVWSGVNPSDVKSRAGTRSNVLPYPQVVPHSDGAGVIDAVGEGVNARRVGERVWIWNGAWARADGTAAGDSVAASGREQVAAVGRWGRAPPRPRWGCTRRCAVRARSSSC